MEKEMNLISNGFRSTINRRRNESLINYCKRGIELFLLEVLASKLSDEDVIEDYVNGKFYACNERLGIYVELKWC